MTKVVDDKLSNDDVLESSSRMRPSSLPPINHSALDDLSSFTMPSLRTTGASGAVSTATDTLTVHKEDSRFKKLVEKGVGKLSDYFEKGVDLMDIPLFKGREYLRLIPFSDGLKTNGVTTGEIARGGLLPSFNFLEGFVGAAKLEKKNLFDGLKRPLPLPDMDDPPKRPAEKK